MNLYSKVLFSFAFSYLFSLNVAFGQVGGEVLVESAPIGV